ncbi:MAG: hypothetical protein ABJF10_02920 [Chthoniobacter sp.]|uniref:hypothetical protein n=1 Tax=Chthoniobacter sp. TaxID=2510640 RepID=UPI0032AC4369
MPLSDEMIDRLLASLTAEWDVNNQDVDLTRRLASAWEDRFGQKRDEESLDGAYYYYHHLNKLLAESDSLVARKVIILQKQKIELRIKSIEDWLAQGGALHAEAQAYRTELQELKMELAVLFSKPMPPGPPAKLFLDLSADRDSPPSSGSASFSAN